MDGYAAQQQEFDWLCEPSVMTRALRELRIGCDAGLAVDVGCGTSSGMAAALREDLGARAVLCLDKEAAAIEFLRREGVNARVCDVANDPDAVVAPGSVDLVVDKSALDCILCSDGVGCYLRGVYTMLRPGGSYAIASFRTEDELRRIFGDAWRRFPMLSGCWKGFGPWPGLVYATGIFTAYMVASKLLKKDHGDHH